MKKRSDSSKRKTCARAKRRPCLMAYTLNNKQPVICTLISDQPYFYMEDELPEDDDALLSDAEFAEFENDLADLKKKMDAYERMSKSYERDPARRLEEFAAEAITMCEEQIFSSSLNIEKLESVLKESRMAGALLAFAHHHGVTIVESDQVFAARYDRDAAKIFVHPGLGDEEACLLTVRELRRHWQHRKGAMIHPLTFHPDQAILINRAQMADLSIAMVRTAWEWQLAGRKNIWDYIENSGMGDLARAFAREAFVDFRSLASGKASAAVFENWFLSERCRHQDKKLIQAMLADHQGYVFSCPAASRSVSIDLITALGEQPFGKNYLVDHARMIIEDPVFTEVRDRSNANFLWFIKFERSFRESEEVLQTRDESGYDMSVSPFLTSDTGASNATATIIPLSGTGVVQKRRGGKFASSNQDANIVYVNFGNANGS